MYFQNDFISNMSHKISLDPYQLPSFGTGYSHHHEMQVHAHKLNYEMLVSEIFYH